MEDLLLGHNAQIGGELVGGGEPGWPGGGAQGVGAATTTAVVASSILILALDYVLTEMFFAQ